LLRLNRQFYDAFAPDFADSRSTLQPGILRALDALRSFKSLIDVGCGDGRVGRALTGRAIERYVGVDFSPKLLDQSPLPLPGGFELMLRDFSKPGWTHGLPRRFDAVVCFSALHHLPGSRRRLRLLRDIRSLLASRARCAISVWQFLHVPRLRRKIVPWSVIGLSDADVDAGDYLLDWQRGGHGLRYVHHFAEAELVALCERAGLGVCETYRSDGQTGDMGLYVIVESMGTRSAPV
jgi:SAM-dependent methyltransferase